MNFVNNKGTLGLPVNLSAFQGPLLSLTGEIDSIPFTHSARNLLQRDSLSFEEQHRKIIAVVPGMDHSDFCQGFHVSGDFVTELSREEALSNIGAVTGAWLNLQIFPVKSNEWMQASAFIEDFTSKFTRPLIQPFLDALEIEKGAFCEDVQRILSGFSEAEYDRLEVRAISVEGGLGNLMHAHSNFSHDNQTNKTIINVPSYASYDEFNNFNYAPFYSGSSEASCKCVSAERIFSLHGLPLPSQDKQKTCREANQHALDVARSLISKYWPKALERFEQQGTPISILPDQFSSLGPQWVYLSHISFDEKAGTTRSAALFTALDSSFFPGNRYCKTLSPSKAIEYIMVRGLNKRYN